jgi:hypothetical protein
MTDHDRANCTMCQHAKEHGWWGDHTATHCRECGATWNMGTSASHCTKCHRTFRSPWGFDHHRSDGACLDPATMTHGPNTKRAGEPLMAATLSKYGTEVWAGTMSAETAAALRDG